MAPEIFKEFAAAFIAERNTILAQQNAHFTAAKTELAQVKARQKTLVKALGDGVSARLVKDELIALEAREDELSSAPGQPARRRAGPASQSGRNLSREGGGPASSPFRSTDEGRGVAIVRTLIDEVRLIPENPANCVLSCAVRWLGFWR